MMEWDGEVVECPMCGRLHRIQPNLNNDGGNDEGNFGFQEVLEAGTNTLTNAQRAGSTATKVVNNSLSFAGFTEQGIKKGSLASGIQSKVGNVSKGSLLSTAQSLGARGGASKAGWLALAVGTAVVVGTASKFLWDKYQERNAEMARKDEEKRVELNLCEDCWKVVRLNET